MVRGGARYALCVLLLCFRGVLPAQAQTPVPPWETQALGGHPLVGKIWQPDSGRFANADAVIAALEGARFVLLGEKHDNPDHHRLQAWLLERMIAQGRRPAVAFEMLDRAQQAALDAHLKAHPKDAAGIGPAVDWAESGWPDWRHYEPIAAAALGAGLPLRAASLPRGEIRALAKEGLGRLGEERTAALGLGQDLSEETEASLRREIEEVHCGLLPNAMIGPMVTVTREKDAEMADSLIRGAAAPGRDGAVLIAGFGHTRWDRGVPKYLHQRVSDATWVSLAFMEVAAGESEPEDYAGLLNSDRLPFDFVWFTPRLDDSDPCEVYADQLRKAGERQNENAD